MGGEKNNEEEEDDGVVVDDDDDDDDATLPRTTEKKESKGGGDGGGVRAGAARGGRGDFGTVYNDDEYDDDDDDDDDEKPPPVFGTGRSGALLQDEKRGDVLRREEPEKGERTENAVRSQRRIRKLSRPKSIEPASGAADAAVRKPGKKRESERAARRGRALVARQRDETFVRAVGKSRRISIRVRISEKKGGGRGGRRRDEFGRRPFSRR